MQLALPEILLILTIALLVFGPKRLPEMGRTIGKGLREMRSAIDGIDPRTALDPDPVPEESDDDLEEMIADDEIAALDDEAGAAARPADPDDDGDWPDESAGGVDASDPGDGTRADTA